MESVDRGQQRWPRVCNRRCGIIFLNTLRLRVSFSSTFLVHARAIQVSTGCIGFWDGKCLRFTVSFTLPQRSLILFRGAKLTLILLRASGFSSTEGGLHFWSLWLTTRELWDLFLKWEVEVNFVCVQGIEVQGIARSAQCRLKLFFTLYNQKLQRQSWKARWVVKEERLSIQNVWVSDAGFYLAM
jgi:hypothetical protein